MKAQHDTHEHAHEHGSFHIATASMSGRLLDRNRKNNHTLCFADAGSFRGNDFDDDITIYLRNSGKLAVKKDAAISSQRAVLLLARLKMSQSECLALYPHLRINRGKAKLAQRINANPPPTVAINLASISESSSRLTACG